MTDKKGSWSNGQALFPSVVGCDMEHGAQIAVYMGHGCGRMVCGVLLALKETKGGRFHGFQRKFH